MRSVSRNETVLSRLSRVQALEQAGKMRKLAARGWRLPTFRAAAVVAHRTGRPIRLRARTVFDEQMTVYAPELVSQLIFERSAFEPTLTRAFVHIVKPGWTVYDVGAHFGYFTLLSSRLVGASGHVHSFEPTPTTRTVLEGNVANKPNVTVSDRAAWSESTDLELRDFGVFLSASNSHYAPRLVTKHESRSFTARTTTLDEYAAEHGAPEFVKIDAESAEYQIVRGMTTLLSTKRPILSIEVGDYGIEGVPPTRELIDAVLAHDYIVAETSTDGLRASRGRDHYDHVYDNILLAPVAAVG